MASAASKMDTLTVTARLFLPVLAGSAGYAAWRVDWQTAVRNFVTGPGRNSRIALLVFVFFNWKNMPFAWTFRVFYAIIYHNVLRRAPELGPRSLFKPMITPTHAPLLETDYNLHKSNSTYFTDLDISRTHLVSFLCRAALKKLSENAKSKMVMDPTTGKVAQGGMSIILGSVSCSFKKEIPSYKGYELWSKVVSWDRKWMYIVTHFVPKGTARPSEWLDPKFSKMRTRKAGDKVSDFEKKIYATAVSKYVFKIGRLTVAPAQILENCNLLPERPGGWMSGDNQVGDESADVSDVDLSVEGEWDWRRVEAQRRQGMEYITGFKTVDELHTLFDGGKDGALAYCGPG